MFDSGSDLRKKASWEFLKYLTGDEVQSTFAISTGYIPSSVGAIESDGYQALLNEKPQYATAPEQLMVTPKEMKSVTVGPSADFYYGIMNGIGDMLNNDVSPEKAAASMASSLQALLDQYARNNI